MSSSLTSSNASRDEFLYGSIEAAVPSRVQQASDIFQRGHLMTRESSLIEHGVE